MAKQEFEQVKSRLLDLARDRESFFRNDGDDDIFREDYDALVKAVGLLDKLEAETARADEVVKRNDEVNDDFISEVTEHHITQEKLEYYKSRAQVLERAIRQSDNCSVCINYETKNCVLYPELEYLHSKGSDCRKWEFDETRFSWGGGEGE